MSEIVEDLKVANVEVSDNLGLTLTSENSRVCHTGTGALEVSTTGTVDISSANDLTLSSGNDLIITANGNVDLVSSNSAKKVNICNSSNSLSFFGITGIDQFNTTTTVTGTGTDNVLRNSTFTGNLGNAAYHMDDIVRALKQYGLLAQNV
jgi:hypothetical protein